jgi:hypothetical protein
LFVAAEDNTVDGQYSIFKNGSDTGVYVQVCLPDDYETFRTTYTVGQLFGDNSMWMDWTEFRSLDRALAYAYKIAKEI